MTDEQIDIDKEIEERFASLPSVVQTAITSADLQKRLRGLADTRKLHIDQWQKLENEVMLTLLGLREASELEEELRTGIGLTPDDATSLTNDINALVFEPIREELERQLEHPEAKEKEMTGIESSREEMLASENASTPIAAEETSDVARVPLASDQTTTKTVLPATPGQPPPTEKAIRAPISSAYTSQQPSSNRKIIEGDPYREPPK